MAKRITKTKLNSLKRAEEAKSVASLKKSLQDRGIETTAKQIRKGFDTVGREKRLIAGIKRKTREREKARSR